MSTSRSVLRVCMLALLAGTASACSSVPDWVDPTNWGGSADSEPATTPSDTSGAATAQPGPGGKTVAEASDQYPVLADTPSKAPPTTSTDEQKQVANGLVADRTQAQYSVEALQAGNEPAAAPPPPASAEANVVVPPTAVPSAPSSAASAASGAAESAPAQPGASPPVPGTLPAQGQPAPATQVVSAPSPPAPSPAPPGAPAAARTPTAAPDDAALGFQPSHAPPLDPAVAQMAGGPAPARDARVASLAPAAPPLAFSSTPAATVMFPAQTIAVDANGLAQVQAAVAAFKGKGGTGYVRVVGHSASGAPNLPADKQMMQSFERSQAVATAVARALIKEGVPASRVLVDATSSLAADEQRRAEIFLQS